MNFVEYSETFTHPPKPELEMFGLLSDCSEFTSASVTFPHTGASLTAQLVKNLPAVQETPVRFLGQEGPLEKGKATHSSILAWRIPWTG